MNGGVHSEIRNAFRIQELRVQQAIEDVITEL